jgi:hypothetical protein
MGGVIMTPIVLFICYSIGLWLVGVGTGMIIAAIVGADMEDEDWLDN